MNDENEKWLDVGTTAIPRLTVERCIGSFLDSIDPCGYKLRWIFHLDQYPEPGLERYWQDTLNQALRLAPRFDSAVIMASTTNQSWGVSVRRIMEQVRHDLIWTEDDYVWLRPWRVEDLLSTVEQFGVQGYNFQRRKVKFGATSPTYWQKHTVDYLLEHFPEPAESASENQLKRILSHKRRGGAGFMTQPRNAPFGEMLCKHIGRDELVKYGFTHNFWGVPLTESGTPRRCLTLLTDE